MKYRLFVAAWFAAVSFGCSHGEQPAPRTPGDVAANEPTVAEYPREYPVEWTTDDGSVVTLTVLRTGVNDFGMEVGVLQATHDGRTQDVATYVIDLAADASARVVVRGPNEALFRYGTSPHSGDPGDQRAYQLGWDGAAVTVTNEWAGSGVDDAPQWATME